MSTNDEIEALLPQLRKIAVGMTRDADRAADLVNDVVVKILANIHQFEVGTNFAGWCVRIMRNTFLSQIKRGAKMVAMDPEAMRDLVTVAPCQETLAILRSVTGAVDRLDPDQRDTMLCVASGMDYEEIAQAEGVPLGTVKSRVNRARAKLMAATQ